MKNKIFIALTLVSVAIVIIAVSCKKERTDSDMFEPYVSDISFTPCNYHGDKGMYNPDSVVVSYSAGTVYVTHYNLEVNCGWQDIDVQIRQSNDTIWVTENEVTPVQANCYCDTDNSFRINNVKGRKTLILRCCDPIFCQTYDFQ